MTPYEEIASNAMTRVEALVNKQADCIKELETERASLQNKVCDCGGEIRGLNDRITELEAIVDANDAWIVLQAQKTEAVEAETERCLREVARWRDQYKDMYSHIPEFDVPYIKACDDIDAAIRKGAE